MAPVVVDGDNGETFHKVNFDPPRSFLKTFKSDLKETFFPDDPFHDFKGKALPIKAKKALQYFVPIFAWLPKYSRKLFMYDLLAGITIASLAISQGISYAKLANIQPIVGLYSSFVPPLIYSVFGSSKHLAVGTVAASSLIIAATIETKVDPTENPQLYLSLALLYVARPASSKLGNIPDTDLYRDVEQYPGATGIPKTLILQLGSPIYFANAGYIRERILRWVRDEKANKDFQGDDVEYVLLDLGGVTSIDITGVETLVEVCRSLEVKEIKVVIVNPRLEVMEKLIVTKFIDKIGKERVFLSIEDAIEGCKFSLTRPKDYAHDER